MSIGGTEQKTNIAGEKDKKGSEKRNEGKTHGSG